jgi:hypothetical protein
MSLPTISVFTPTHNAEHLLAAYRSLRLQTTPCHEWVIVPNNGAVVPEEIAAEPWVKIVPAPKGAAPGIGFLKKLACVACAGELLLELDHDDLLTQHAVAAVAEAAAATGAGFLYSDFINFTPDGASQTYDRAYGWETYPVTYDGEAYTAIAAFEPEPGALHHVRWAPNHVRVWTREAYDQVGGHDASLPVADDHDLICRTYRAGIEFHHIPQALYLYRERPKGPLGKNTYRTDAKLAELSLQVSNRHTVPLVEEWCRREGLMKLDLTAPGAPAPAGYTALPIQDWLKTHVATTTNSVGCLRAHDALPHLPPETIAPFWNWAYRVLAPGGWLCVRCASTDGRGAWQNPLYRSGWNANSFWYATRLEHQNQVPGLNARFQAVRQWDGAPSEWHATHGITYTNADLVALKGQRVAGEIAI